MYPLISTGQTCLLFSRFFSFVPALYVVAEYFNIPDDVAGATLMAAGASSPELFSSFVSLFVTHSALGLGTIVGSEIFNQLIICAGAVFAGRFLVEHQYRFLAIYITVPLAGFVFLHSVSNSLSISLGTAAKNGDIVLDKAIVIREAGFYALSIVLLLYALGNSQPDEDDPLGGNHIFISFTQALVLFLAYVAYVLVCANFPAIVAFCFKTSEGGKFADKRSGYGSIASPSSEKSKVTTVHATMKMRR